MTSVSWTKRFHEAPPDPIMQANAEYTADTRPEKVNAGIGMIMDPKTGMPFAPKIVRKIGKEIAFVDSGYLSSMGYVPYLVSHARELVFGKELWAKISKKREDRERPDGVVLAQTIGGTKALSLAATILDISLNKLEMNILLDTGWPNYNKIFKSFRITNYVHEDPKTRKYNHEGYMKKLTGMKKRSIVVLQVCGYNDDGCDRSPDEWDEVLDVIEDRKLQPIFDFAYNGLAEGWDKDNYPVNACIEKGIVTIVCASNSKNCTYSARLGSLYIVNLPEKNAHRIQGTLVNDIIRPDYSNPNAVPAQVMARILNDPSLAKQYKDEIDSIRVDLLDKNRNAFADELGEDFAWLKNRRGVFVKLFPQGFTKEQVSELKEKYAIHSPQSSRINIGGIPPKRVREIGQIYRKVIGS